MPWGQNLPKLAPEAAQQVRDSQQIILQNFLYLDRRLNETRFESGTDGSGPLAAQIRGLAKFCAGEYVAWKKLLGSGESTKDAHSRIWDLQQKLTAFADDSSNLANRPDDERLGLLRVWIERAEALVEPMLPVRIATPDTAKTQEIGDTLRSLRPSLPPQTTSLTYSGANIEPMRTMGK